MSDHPVDPLTLGARVSVDDGEVWAEREVDGVRVGCAINPEGDSVSHLLPEGEARMLATMILTMLPEVPDAG